MCVFVWQTRKPRQWTKWTPTVFMAALPACSTGCLCRTSRSKLRCCAACSIWGSREHSCRPASGSRDTPVVATGLSTTSGLENQLFISKTSDMSQFLAKHREREYVSHVILCIDLPDRTVGRQNPSYFWDHMVSHGPLHFPIVFSQECVPPACQWTPQESENSILDFYCLFHFSECVLKRTLL